MSDPPTIDALEPGQLVHNSSRPVARAHLSPRVRAALWALRILTVALAAMVVVSFVLELT